MGCNYKSFHGSYLSTDVTFLLKPIDIKETGLFEKENSIQSGQKHYSEMISQEYEPSEEYIKIFHDSFNSNKEKLAKHLLALAKKIAEKGTITLVSLARAGTPIGVLLKRILQLIFSKDVSHYSISIIRDRGIDENALNFILKSHNDESIVFIDGWTGKGVISRELKKYIDIFNAKNNTNISSDLYVLSDISGTASISSTYEDYLIPSSVLNSTISGLISRSILNKDFIDSNDFHGCKYYKEFEHKDLSLWFVDQIIDEVKKISTNLSDFLIENNLEQKINLNQISNNFINQMLIDYKVNSVNYIKPGIGETTRVLLRRVPNKILLKDLNNPEIKHLITLANEKKTKVLEFKNMPYKAVGIISKMEKSDL